MGSPEVVSSQETPQQKYGAIVVLGENIKEGWGPKEIREDKFHLSPYSKANTLAATILYLKGASSTFIFSTGHTAGKIVPSEAEAMKNYFIRIIQPIRYAARINPTLGTRLNCLGYFQPITEERSLTTSQNAKEVKKFLKEYYRGDNTKLGLLVPSFHAQRADYHFKRQGLRLQILKTEDVLEQVMPCIKDKFMNPDMVAQEIKRENIIRKIENLPLGTTATSLVARLTRK